MMTISPLPNFDKLLLPVDFQNPSLGVVHQAAALARHFHSQIVILHVVTPLSYSAGALKGSYVPASRDDLLAELLKQAQEDLDRTLRPELQGIDVKRILLKGDPALCIVQTAKNEKANLIVMPTHGYGPFRRFLLGSVTAKVLHDSVCPVWTGAHIEEPLAADFAIRNILCAIDLTDHSRKTLSRAAHLADELGARLTLAHVTSGLELYDSGSVPVIPEWKAMLVKVAGEEIAKLQQEVGTKAEVFIDSGDVPTVLSRAVKDSKADVLVIGRRTPGGHLGGSGYGIVREAQIPVLSL
jgi:nucleotide-binding universal stress UspA family protein